jgi:death on curing protein
LHTDQIERYGGRPGIRDVALLQSALAAPAATFGGSFLHETLDEMAAAYLFHLARNHPFVDGNKRTALIAMVAFLGLNGFRLVADADEVFELVAGVARGTTSRAEVAVFVKRSRRRRRP